MCKFSFVNELQVKINLVNKMCGKSECQCSGHLINHASTVVTFQMKRSKSSKITDLRCNKICSYSFYTVGIHICISIINSLEHFLIWITARAFSGNNSFTCLIFTMASALLPSTIISGHFVSERFEKHLISHFIRSFRHQRWITNLTSTTALQSNCYPWKPNIF